LSPQWESHLIRLKRWERAPDRKAKGSRKDKKAVQTDLQEKNGQTKKKKDDCILNKSSMTARGNGVNRIGATREQSPEYERTATPLNVERKTTKGRDERGIRKSLGGATETFGLEAGPREHRQLSPGIIEEKQVIYRIQKLTPRYLKKVVDGNLKSVEKAHELLVQDEGLGGAGKPSKYIV